MQGWIKLHRELINKPIWTESSPEQKAILITLLLMANHDEKQWEWKGKKYVAKPGQFVTSLNSIVKMAGIGISIRNVRTALHRFEKYGFLTNESTNRNRLITIVNWGVFQEKEVLPTKKATSDRQTDDKQLTTNKNVRMKECKNNNNKRHKFEICDMRLAELFFNKIRENNPSHRKPNLNKWANDIRLMRERDKRTEEQIEYLIDWTQTHEFWHANILSPAKLRKQFDTLVMQVKRDKGEKSKVTPITEARSEKYKYNLGF
ncbi:Replication protein O [Pseudogracilibacillus auburnensis]|uniref:PaaX-like protein n=1 Tax=Pseudogracilibacillus auburnensis TaxID=1494959 RepID=A0A2V3W485_9BACI|nr:DNA replication protein DnaD [Pseudogracilibacillus auburnensis]PXW88790.1 PaaX-like protein [Pseudogracilibacillus auburnensis]